MMQNLTRKLAIIMMALLSTSCAQEKINVIAHRGASGYAPENTLIAMKTAVEMGADYAELDAQETLDGEIIILHDKTLKRTSGLEGNIWELNYDSLSRYDVGAWFDEKFKGEPVPKLTDVIDLVKGKIKLNIELKTNGHEKLLADRVVQVVKDKDFLDQCIFTSFDFSQADRVKEINPELKAGYIMSKLPQDINVFSANVDILSAKYKIVDQDFMAKAKENNKEVFVWTVNEEEDMKRMIELGVKNIITNYPDKLKKLLAETGKN